MSAPRLICVTGTDGAGKSTVIARLAEILTRRWRTRAIAVTIWDVLDDPRTRRLLARGAAGAPLRFRSPAGPRAGGPAGALRLALDAYLASLEPPGRALLLLHCWSQALARARAGDAAIHLLDGYWYKCCASEVALGARPAALVRLAEVLPEPSAIFHLRVDPAVAARRKTRHSPYESGFATPSVAAFVAFQRRVGRALRRVLAPRRAVELDAHDPVERNVASILAAIAPLRRAAPARNRRVLATRPPAAVG